MGWRLRRSISLGGGARSTMTSRGMGASWGLAGLRIGRSPTGSFWVSFTIPGTGISFFKYLSTRGHQNSPVSQPIPAALSHPQRTRPAPTFTPPAAGQLTANQRIVDEIMRKKP